MSWDLSGMVVVACSCDDGCPCDVNARPTTQTCEGGWTGHVDEAQHNEVGLGRFDHSGD